MKAPHIAELQVISQNTDSQSFPTSGTTMEYINKEPEWGLGATVARNSKESRAVGRRISCEFTRWNVNRTDGWVSKALCCPEEVWSRAAGPPLTGPDYVEMGSLLWGEHSSAHAALLQCIKVTSETSPVGFLPPTLWPIALHAAGFVDYVQAMFKQSVPLCKAHFKAYLT